MSFPLRRRPRTRLNLHLWILGLVGFVVLAMGLFARLQVVSAQGSPGSISFTQSAINVNENAGSASVTVTRTGGTTGRIVGKVGLTDVSTSPADYVFKPGSPDLTFPTQQLSFFFHGHQAIALQPDGKIICASSRVRLNANGTVDPTFNAPVFNSPGYSAAVQADGKVIIIGGFTSVGGVRKNGLARLNSDGSLDNSFDAGFGTSNGNVIAFQSDGKIIIAGIFDRFNNDDKLLNIVRLNTDGSVDPTFVKGTSVSSTYAVAVQPDGKILMGGFGIARLNSDGSVDSSFNTQFGSVVFTNIVLQPDGKIIVAGGFNNYGGTPVYNIARLNADGSLDTSFNTGSGPDGGVGAIVVQPDGKIVIGGTFDSINGTFRSKIARLNSDGSVDTSFAGIGTVSGTRVEALLMQDNGKLVGSGFFSFATTPVSYIVLGRFNGDLFATWNDGDSADKTINLPIVDDSLQEPNETLSLTLTPLQGGAAGGAITNATLTINDNDVAPAFTSGAPPQGITRTNYSHTFTATGTPSPTFSVTGGTLPNGLFLQSTGLLSGQPTTAGTFSNITVTASNGVSPVATQTFSITILSGGTLQFSSSTYNVGEADGPIVLTVTRTGGSAGATSVNFLTSSNTAMASDYTSTSGTLNFVDGEISKTISVPITSDSLDESNETFVTFLNTVTGSGSLVSPTSTTVTILDDDVPPSVSVNDVTLTEGNSGTKLAVFNVTLSSASGLTVSMNFATASGTAMGTGPAVLDYTHTSSVVTFFPGSVSQTVSVQIRGDAFFEPDEAFSLNLSNPVNATISRAQGTGTIQNDDAFQLAWDTSGPFADQALALDSLLFTRDPFTVISSAAWMNLGSDRNTRVLFFSNFLLDPGVSPSTIVARFVGGDGQIYEVSSESVSRISNTPYSQVRFRLPDGLVPGICLVNLKAHGQTSIGASFRIAP